MNHILGKALTEIMKEHSENQLTVLCGHTHHHAVYEPLSNLRVLVGHADYGFPEVQEPINV